MDLSRPLERRHSNTSVPQSTMVTAGIYIAPGQNVDIQHSHFVIMYIDDNGKLQIRTSDSIAGCGGAIFTPEVTDRFMEMTVPSPQSNTQFAPDPSQTPTSSPWGVQSSPEWFNTGQTRPAEMIPCEWQSNQSRRKRRDMKRTGMVRPPPKAASPPPTPPPGRTVLRVGNRDLLRRYYEKAFEDFQQLNCRAIAKSYIKLVEPRKQVHFPYNGRKVIAGVSQRVDPEMTKPGWWPVGVLHREPDHLLKRDRLRLLVHILCEMKDTHGVTADKLREAGQDVRRQISPPNRLQVLDEIYFVRQMEERFLDGKIDANTLVQVTQTHLPDAIYQDDELSSRIHAAPTTSLDDEEDNEPSSGHSSQIDEAEQFILGNQMPPPLPQATPADHTAQPPASAHTQWAWRLR
ncbi:uncharacterized protein N7498_006994 [Penicillium cinerascens]|uniref:Subtelomeric hrmA-associated cluster protein AFUB-079030/YDR124W-like helical bundle domain-containing protein n=1 Tax=Penicillium cinerascens TaxID=70096 RepID=A0A9W9JL08_9EURO|nr:uncharacterized protein N7498_006994 [Penicillium cinerascens]KAJ5197877.1 hypothetical protein N7498_006994 [Penicillium cinerascens]